MSEASRWKARPVLAAAVYGLIFGAPVGGGILTGTFLIRALPRPSGFLGHLVAWILVTALSMVVVQGLERLTRRLLPLAALLKLSLLFPDRPPPRFGVALRSSSTRNIDQIVAAARHTGLGDDAEEVAARVLELVGALNVHDRRTRGHSERVRALTTLIADELHLSPADRDRLQWAALLHDVGKLVVHADILNKAGKPTDEEWEILRGHPVEGAKLVQPLRAWLGEWADTIEQHHEAFDGTGYPRGLRGHEISYGARVVAVADTYDVIVSARSYKAGIPAPEALAELSRCAGRQFDPAVVRAFLALDRRRLRWAMGPLSSLANIPSLARAGLPELGSAVTAVATAAGVAVGSTLPRTDHEPRRDKVTLVAQTGAGPTPPTTAPPVSVPLTAVAPSVVEAPSDEPRLEVAPSTTARALPEPTPAPEVALRDLAGATDQDSPVRLAPAFVVASGSTVDPATLRVVTAPANGTVSVDSGSGTFTYTPWSDATGADTFAYEVCSTDGICTSGIATIDVIAVPGPVALADAATTTEDASVVVDVLANDHGPKNALVPSSVRVISLPARGATSVDGGTGRITYTPWADWSGTETFTYEVCDLRGRCATALVTVEVAAVDDAPVAGPDAATTTEDTPVTIDVLANDTDADANLDPTTLRIVAAPATGNASVQADHTVLYLPDANINGFDSFTYEVCDTTGQCAATTVVAITVSAIDDDPVAVDDAATTPEELAVTIDVLANDTDADGNIDPSSVTVSSGPFNGAVAIDGATGAITYTPYADFSGTDAFGYTVADASRNVSAAAIVTVTVTAVNDAPVAADDAAGTPEDEGTTINVLANDTDIDSALDAGSVTVVAGPGNGTASVDATTGEIAYRPNPDFNGSDSFSYVVCDVDGLCSGPALVSVTVTPMADPITASDDAATLKEDGSKNVAPLANDSSVNGPLDPTTLRIVAGPANGTASVDDVDAEIKYSASPDFNGTDSLVYEICDNSGACAQATITYAIEPVNDKPVGVTDTAITAEDTAVTLAVISNDSDVDGNIDPSTVTVSSAPSNGTTSVDPVTGAITYAPNANFSGTDSFKYKVCDTASQCSEAVDVSVTVTAVSDRPVSANDAVTTTEETPVTIAVLANDAGIDGPLDSASVEVMSAPANGTAAVNLATGAITYTPNTNFNGTDSLTYAVRDVAGTQGAATTATITVTPLNDAPVAVADTAATLGPLPVTISVLSNDFDVDGDALTVSLTALPLNGSATVNGGGQITYWPNLLFIGTDQLSYRVCDTAGACSVSVTVTITVTASTTVQAFPDAVTTPQLVAGRAQVRNNDLASSGQSLVSSSVRVTTPPANGTTFVRPDGSIEYTSIGGFVGVDRYEYEVCDTSGACGTSYVDVTVIVNNPPVAIDDAVTTFGNTSVNINVTGNDRDPEGYLDLFSPVVETAPVNGGTLSWNSATHVFAYTPASGFVGIDSFQYRIFDAQGFSAVATVTVTVLP